MSRSSKPNLSRTTPFPNELIDEAMPRVNDTQWRVLCVVVRQTLGWHDRRTGTRKIRDWLTQSQLKARTGRNVEALVEQGTIVVEGENGHPLDSSQRRQAYRGRIYYRLSDVWQMRIGLLTSDKREDSEQVSNSVFRTEARKTEFDSSGKPNTTKETFTKEKRTKENLFQLETDFYVAFMESANQYGKAVSQTGLALQEREQLQRWLSVTPKKIWKPLLSMYFESDLPYVIRHGHSLAAFLNTRYILRHRKYPAL